MGLLWFTTLRVLSKEVGKQSSELRMTFIQVTLHHITIHLEGWYDTLHHITIHHEGWCETLHHITTKQYSTSREVVTMAKGDDEGKW